MKFGKWIPVQLFLDINPEVDGLFFNWILIQLFLDIYSKQDKNPEIAGLLSRNSWIKISSKNLAHLDKYPE